jgi:hypothetical protein
MLKAENVYTVSVWEIEKSQKSQAGNLFWYGFLIYTLAYITSKGFPAYAERLSYVQIGGLALSIPATFALIRFRFESLYLKFIFILYFTWSCFIILKGNTFGYEQIKNSLTDADYGILIYFAPIALLFPKDFFLFKKLFWTISILGVLYILFSFYFRHILLNPVDDDLRTGQGLVENFSKTLSFPCGFVLLTYVYHSKKRLLLAFLVVLLTLLLALIRARRGLAFFEVSFLLGGLSVYFSVNKKNSLRILVLLCLLVSLGFYVVKSYKENKTGLFNRFTERVDEDTRSGVEECFYEDMKTNDWIMGRGIYGKYLCPGIDEGLFTDYRSVIETGYLNIILKGGIIELGLLLLIAIPAVIKGIFFSKNYLAKASGAWIFLWVISLYPATLNSFNLDYILLWIAIGICYSKGIRNIPEEQIKELLSSKHTRLSSFI